MMDTCCFKRLLYTMFYFLHFCYIIHYNVCSQSRFRSTDGPNMQMMTAFYPRLFHYQLLNLLSIDSHRNTIQR